MLNYVIMLWLSFVTDFTQQLEICLKQIAIVELGRIFFYSISFSKKSIVNNFSLKAWIIF